MSEVTVTTTTITAPVTVVCLSGPSITVTVTMASMLVGLTTFGEDNMVLLPQLIQRETMRGSVGLNTAAATTTGMCQLCHGSTGEVFLGAFHQIICFMLVSVLLFVFCFKVWLSCLPVGAQPLGFLSLQSFRIYPWQAYLPPGYGPWPMQGVHWVAAPPTALSRGSFMLLIKLSLSHSIHILEHTALGTQQRVTQSFCLPYMAGRCLLFQVVFHLVMQSTLNLWWVLNLVILVW